MHAIVKTKRDRMRIIHCKKRPNKLTKDIWKGSCIMIIKRLLNVNVFFYYKEMCL